MNHGVLAAGNWIVDQVKIIDTYPGEERLVNILAEHSSNGGSAYNILKAFQKLNTGFPLSAAGLVGDDERGEKIISECNELKINTAQLVKMPGVSTSYTDVMSVQSTGKRTFFHHRGANALLSKEHIEFRHCEAKIFHLGYLLLLDELDKKDAHGRSGASYVLEAAKNKGLITSADIVSEHSSRFNEIIPCALPFIDCLFVNEFEAKMLSHIDTLSSTGEVSVENCIAAATAIVKMGVQKWVVLHFPGGAVAVNGKGEQLLQKSINMPSQKIAGAVGAGDAFAAGVLTGVHNEREMSYCLELGVCAAASSLTQPTSSDGILPVEECLQMGKLYGFRE